MTKQKVVVFWFRRDLRLDDNIGLNKALRSGLPVLPLFIFDTDIIAELPANDSRVNFIYDNLELIDNGLREMGSSLLVRKGKPLDVWESLTQEFDIAQVFTNKDYEPYAIRRDGEIEDFLTSQHIQFHLFKDQVIFEENEVVKSDGNPYTVYTPYKNKWLSLFTELQFPKPERLNSFYKYEFEFPGREMLGIESSTLKVQPFQLHHLADYEEKRNIPHLNATSFLSPHLRFGTVSIRQIVDKVKGNSSFLNELIWREFFMQILFHFPHVVNQNFKSKYDGVKWRNNEDEFAKWCAGKTGYPLVDAGMRQLNETGYMHNRVRMVVAGFLCKHLLIDWRWGEAYFAQKLLDYELSANNGNWQWAAGTGCDSAPYFRIFNPTEQVKKFDPKLQYIRRWIPEYDTLHYAKPMVEHTSARKRALEVYRAGLE